MTCACSTSAVVISTGRTLALALVLLFGLVGCSTAEDGPAASTADAPTVQWRDAAVRVAEQAAVTLVSLDHRDPEAGYDRLLELLTNPARQEWEQRRAEYLAPITSDVVTTELAAVTASGVAALDPAGTTATVLVAATATVSTVPAPEPDERRYRLRMSLTRTADEWKVSELQMVS